MTTRLILAGLLAICLVLPSSAAEYVVDQSSPLASDQNSGTAEAPWQTIAKANAMVQAGDTVTIKAGVYRESLLPKVSGMPDHPITYQAARLADGTFAAVVISGADVFAGWERDGAGWRYAGGTYGVKDSFLTYSTDFTFRREQVMCDGAQLTQVSTREELAPGTFWVDAETRALAIRLPHDDDPAGHVIEASMRYPLCGSPDGKLTDLHIRGLIFRYSCNRAQWGAMRIDARWLVEDCTVEWSIGTGIGAQGENWILRRVRALHNGQIGLGGSGVEGLIEDCEFSDNNWKGFSAGWEAGGFKICNAWGVKVLNSVALRNRGPGMWFDIDNRACEVRQCRCQDNTASGIFIEISGDFLVTDNLCTGNGGREPGDWAGAGISLGESRDCYVAFNTCVGNQYGLSIRGQVPRFGGDEQTPAYRDENMTIRNNLLAYNQRAGFGLMWDNDFFGRHPNARDMSEQEWQAGLAQRVVDPGTIGLVLDANYYACPDTPLVCWGVGWRDRSKVYHDLPTLQVEQGQERTGRSGEVSFADRAVGDYQLTPSMAVVAKTVGLRYPAAGMVDIVAPAPEAGN